MVREHKLGDLIERCRIGDVVGKALGAPGLHGPLSRDRRKIRSGPVGPSTPVQARRLPHRL